MERGVKVVAGTAVGCWVLLVLGIAIGWSFAVKHRSGLVAGGLQLSWHRGGTVDSDQNGVKRGCHPAFSTAALPACLRCLYL